ADRFPPCAPTARRLRVAAPRSGSSGASLLHAPAPSDRSRPRRNQESLMQARKQQFKVGDKAVYPSRGVAEVVSIEEKDIAGKRQKFYVLHLPDLNQKIMVPVAN